MNCYNHPDTQAVAICKNCNKGLCHECLTELENGIACTATCIDEVTQLNKLVQTSKTSTKRVAGSYFRSTFIYIGMALLFFYFGFTIAEPPMRAYLFGAGGIFLIGGALTIYSGTRYKKN